MNLRDMTPGDLTKLASMAAGVACVAIGLSKNDTSLIATGGGFLGIPAVAGGGTEGGE